MISNDLIKEVKFQNLKFNKLTLIKLDKKAGNTVLILKGFLSINKNQYHLFKIHKFIIKKGHKVQ